MTAPQGSDSIAAAPYIEDGQTSEPTTTVGKTLEAGESAYRTPEDRTMWWRFRALVDGVATFNTYGSLYLDGSDDGGYGYDTTMQLFVGPETASTWSELTFKVGNDDISGQNTLASLAQVALVAGETAYIQVAPYRGNDDGYVVLNCSFIAGTAPPNDDFADAYELVPGQRAPDFSNGFASTEADERNYITAPYDGHTLWYVYRAQDDRPVTIDFSGSSWRLIGYQYYSDLESPGFGDLIRGPLMYTINSMTYTIYPEPGRNYWYQVDSLGAGGSPVTVRVDFRYADVSRYTTRFSKLSPAWVYFGKIHRNGVNWAISNVDRTAYPTVYQGNHVDQRPQIRAHTVQPPAALEERTTDSYVSLDPRGFDYQIAREEAPYNPNTTSYGMSLDLAVGGDAPATPLPYDVTSLSMRLRITWRALGMPADLYQCTPRVEVRDPQTHLSIFTTSLNTTTSDMAYMPTEWETYEYAYTFAEGNEVFQAKYYFLRPALLTVYLKFSPKQVGGLGYLYDAIPMESRMQVAYIELDFIFGRTPAVTSGQNGELLASSQDTGTARPAIIARGRR